MLGPILRRISIAGLLIAVAFIVYAVIHSGNLAKPTGTFDECMVTEMRGQSIFMEPTVRKTCARRFGLIYDISNSGIILDWGVSQDAKQPTVTMKVRPNNTEWYVTRATVTYAYRRCDAQPPVALSEFTGSYTVEFTGEAASLTLPGHLDQYQSKYALPACQKIVQLWGRYR